MLSLAYIFRSRGLISVDYELTKYNNSKFDDNNGEDSYLKSLNNSIVLSLQILLTLMVTFQKIQLWVFVKITVVSLLKDKLN